LPCLDVRKLKMEKAISLSANTFLENKIHSTVRQDHKENHIKIHELISATVI
jgi:hypothetical protein